MNINYKRATIDDIGALVTLRLNLHKERLGERDEATYKAMAQQLTAYLLQSLATDKYIAWVAYADGNAAGMGAFITQDVCSILDWPFVKMAYVCNMYTLPQYRSNGICSSIVKLMLETAKEMGIAKLELHASPTGEAIYRNMGFEPHAEPYLVKDLRK